VVAALQQETDSILGSLGLHLSWRSLAGHRANEVSQQLAVVTFQGWCDNSGLPGASLRSGGLGWTHVTDGEILPFMEIDCDHIRGFVRNQLRGFDPAGRDALLGRALGRVLVHELFHILGRKTHHGSGALDRPAYSELDLVSDDFQLEATECHILQDSDSGVPPQGPGPDAAADSARRGRVTFVEHGCSVCHGAAGEGTRRAPAVRTRGRVTNPVELATMLAIDSAAMCRRAQQLKMAPPSLGRDELADLVRFLNAPPF
jgi:hypothetical protein